MGKSDFIARTAAAWPEIRGQQKRLLICCGTTAGAQRMRADIRRYRSGAWPIGVTVRDLSLEGE